MDDIGDICNSDGALSSAIFSIKHSTQETLPSMERKKEET